MSDPQTLRLGIVGLGTIATAVATSLARRGFALTVSERGAANAAKLGAEFTHVTVAPNQAVVDASDLVFIGTTGAQAPGVLSELTFRADQRVVSFMADLDVREVAKLVAPAQFEALMIPFPGIAQGGSPVLVQPASDVLQDLFGAEDSLYPMASDAALQSYMSAQAVLSPVVKLLCEANDWLTVHLEAGGQADPQASQAFLRQLIGNSLMARPLADGDTLTDLIAALNTPGGFNAELREVLGQAGAYEALNKGLDGLKARYD